MKKVTVFTTAGGAGTVVETNAKTWGELQADLNSKNIKHSGMKAVNGGNRSTLESPDSIIGDADMTLFLFPVKTKSGAGKPVFTAAQVDAMSYGDLRANIKTALETDREGANAHFNEGKNYTNKSTADMRELLKSYTVKGGSASTKSATAAAPKKSGKAETAVVKTKPKAETKAVTKTKNVADLVGAAAKKTSSAVTKQPSKVRETKTVEGSSLYDTMVSQINNTPGLSDADKSKAIDGISHLKPKAEGEVDLKALEREAREIAKGLPGLQSF